MKIALMLGRGLEGCGVTQYVLETRKIAQKLGHECTIYSSLDKKWPRRNGRTEPTLVEFRNEDLDSINTKLNECEVVFIFSVPSKKHSEEFQLGFFEKLVKRVTTKKFLVQCDHKKASLNRNSKLWETVKECDGVFTHSFGSDFAKEIQKQGIVTNVMKLGLGLDCDEFRSKFWKPLDQKADHFTFIGRAASFKDPERMFAFMPFIKNDFIVSMLGIERSIGALSLIERPGVSYIGNFEEKHKNALMDTDHCADFIRMYGPYIHDEGMDYVSRSLFASDFYHLKPDMYGDNLEFAMCEIIACGTVPIFDLHWAENCKHANGTRFVSLPKFALYCTDQPNSVELCSNQMKSFKNPEVYDDFRENSFKLLKEHCDSIKVYGDMFAKAVECPKLNLL